MKRLTLSCVICFWLVTNCFSAEPIRVTLLNPDANHWFWQMTVSFMQAAADDLGMELEVIDSGRNHLLTVRQVAEISRRSDPPQYIITGNEKGIADEIIRIADKAGVKIFLFSNGFVDSETRQDVGKPREKYHHWIGELIPNNYSAGYQMGSVLIAKARERGLTGGDGKINIVAIAGTHATHASVRRVEGLKQAIDDNCATVRLLQVIPGDWSAERAEKIGEGIFKRYKNIHVIWGANDSTAIGAMDAAISFGKDPGENVLFGGCGWYAPAIKLVQEGKLTTTVGGHFMEGGWAMVMIYDYHHGRDFISDPVETRMFSIDASNIQKFSRVFGIQDWEKIDFRQFSKTHNPKLEHYDFSLDAVLKQFEADAVKNR